MQNAAFRELGLDCVYVAYRVSREHLSGAVQGMRSMGIAGLNVTIPHKVAIMSLLDEVDGLAKDIGAVNTLVNRNGRLIGYNTDASGFRQSLAGIDLEGTKAVIIGAGGAARSAAFVLARERAELTILNRHLEKAQQLASQVGSLDGEKPVALALNEENLASTVKDARLLVNTTNVGMSPGNDQTPVSERLLRPGMIVFDIIYNPPETRLLVEAEKRGAAVINGIEMLVQQGASSFELWTGRKAPVDMMRKTVYGELR
jgi:shikimate dehydrogenase